MEQSNKKFAGLVKKLIEKGYLSEESAKQAVDKSSIENTNIVSYLVKKNLVHAETIAQIASQESGIEYVDLSDLNIKELPIDSIPERLIRKYHVIPLYIKDNYIYIGFSDLTYIKNALEEIQFNTKLKAKAVITDEDKLSKLVDTVLNNLAMNSLGNLSDDDVKKLDESFGESIEIQGGEETVDLLEKDTESAPVVSFLNKIIMEAIARDASDIHLEPYETNYRVRLRQDGVLSNIRDDISNSLGQRITARVKVLSKMDLAERRAPQDGRIKMAFKGKSIDFRVSSCPTLYGEKIVMRLLDPNTAKIGIDALGYEEKQKEIFVNTVKKPYGMVLVTGPTGSGKTVSLYTALNMLNTEQSNISAVEDPAEINLPGINQVNINTKVGLDFATALRSFLRQDPDIIMVGEIRDLETAEIAIKAAQTGHMVLSTLHTNDAPQTLTRLMNMGVPAYNIASSVSLIIAQRLARRLCENCKKPANIPNNTLLDEGFKEEELENLEIYEANFDGCSQCNGGFKGRIGIYQVMPVEDNIQNIIMEGGNSNDIERQALKNNVNDLRESGLNKVRQGIISLMELNRVTVE